MKKIIYSLLSALVVTTITSCVKDEYVAPTAEREGLTSLTAIFTSGPFVDQEMAKLYINDEGQDRYVIPVPWFYPETSDDETSPYMNKVRIKAEIDNNCRIDPPLTLIDLTVDNWFTYTNAMGESRRICITGERVKSDKCDLLAFSIIEPAISGIIDKNNRRVSLISSDDLSEVFGEAQVSPHATISPDPETTAIDYNDPVEFTVTAHNGTSKTVYTVVKSVPQKIPYGFNASSMELLFNFDPVATLGLPSYSETIQPTLASINNHLIICTGTGATPIYINRLTGAKLGEINLGQASPGSVTSDENNNMLIVNKAEGGEVVNIYRTSSVTDTPTLYYSFTNPSSLPLGDKFKVNGSIDGDALIVFTNYGISGVTSSSSFTVLTVRGGAVTSVDTYDMSATGFSWGNAPVNSTTVVSASTDAADGWFEAYYGDGSLLNWVKSDLTIGTSLDADMTGWGLNPNCLDSKTFNNARYMSLFVVSHFPSWGMGPELYLYDVTDISRLAAGDVTESSALAYQNRYIDWYQEADNGCASGDVLISPTADGFKLFLFYYDHNSGVIGGYSADCIAQ